MAGALAAGFAAGLTAGGFLRGGGFFTAGAGLAATVGFAFAFAAGGAGSGSGVAAMAGFAGSGGGSVAGGSAAGDSSAGGSSAAAAAFAGSGGGSCLGGACGAGAAAEPAGGEFPTVRGGASGLRSSESSAARPFLRGLASSAPGDAAFAAGTAGADGRSNAPARNATTSAPAATAPPITHFPKSPRCRRPSLGGATTGDAPVAGAGSGFTIAVASGPPGIVVPATRTGAAGSTAPPMARAASAAGATAALETRGAAVLAAGGVADRSTTGIGDGRDGGGGEARFVPDTIGFVAGSGSAGSEAGRELAAAPAGLPSLLGGGTETDLGGGTETGFGRGAAAGFVGDEPTASFGGGRDAPGLAAGVFFIFTTWVGDAVSGRSLGGISCPSLPL